MDVDFVDGVGTIVVGGGEGWGEGGEEGGGC